MANYLFGLMIFVVGLSGLVGQVLLLRELWVSFYGNELTLGVILANWLVWEAAGVFLTGKIIDRIKNSAAVFIALNTVFSLSLPLCVFLARTYRSVLGIPFGEAPGLNLVFLVSFAVVFCPGFSHGGLFSAGCKIYSLRLKELTQAVGKLYAWETIGTLSGGIVLTYIFIPYLSSLQTALLVSLVSLFFSFLFSIFAMPKARVKYLLIALLVGEGCLFLGGRLALIDRYAANRLFGENKVLDYRSSLYGNVAVTKEKGQYTFFYNGLPVITAPHPDQQFVEDLSHFPMLFHPQPQEVLVISAGSGGLINEMLKYPLEELDYLELDYLLIEMLRKYPTPLTRHELQDKRVRVINSDGRSYLRSASKRYDLILIGISNQSDLITNRLFTQEFFSLVKQRLNPSGIAAFWVSGSLVYLSAELRDLNASVLNGFKANFPYIRIIPGDYNIFMGSPSKGIMEVDADLFWKRAMQRGIKTSFIRRDYIGYRLEDKWLGWFNRSLSAATKRSNRDLYPYAVFKTLEFSNKKLFPSINGIFALAERISISRVSLAISLLTLVILLLSFRFPLARIGVVYAIGTSGFFAMLVTLILTFSFQVFYGYLYERIGILMSVFMTGAALGSIAMSSRLKEIGRPKVVLLFLEALLMFFIIASGLIIPASATLLNQGYLIFGALFLISGLLVGAEFPLATRIYLRRDSGIGEASGALYAADLLGGWLAGILGGIILLPVLGVVNSCVLLALIKLSSFILLKLTG